MATSLQRIERLYISKTRESSFNTLITAGANYNWVVADTPLLYFIQQEFRDDRGRNGSEFLANRCPTYWPSPAFNISTDADFDTAARLMLRWAGGAVTDTTVLALLAGKHVAPMLVDADGLELPSFDLISVNNAASGDASFLYGGVVVGQFTLSQEGVNQAKAQFNLIGSGIHKRPHSVSSLPSSPSFPCFRPFSYFSYDNGDPVDLAAGCELRSWTVTGNNNVNPPADRCTSDSAQDPGDPTAAITAAAAAYNSQLTHGDRTLEGQFVVLLDSIAQYDDIVNSTDITGLTIGVRGADLDPTGTPGVTFESLKIVVPTSLFKDPVNVDSNGKAGFQVSWEVTSTGAAAASVEVVNGTIGTFA